MVIDLEGAPQYELVPGADPLTHSLILRGTVLPRGPREIAVADQVIRTLKLEAAGRAEAKLTVFLVKPAALSVFLLKPYQDKPDRLVIDISRPDLEEKEKAGRQLSRELKAGKKKIIVLDPGHGGEDPGAIGPRGTMEKEIVLSLAQGLQKVLDSTGETRAFLTRRGDYFVPLSERVKIAQEYGADLFISLHANGSRSRQTRGTSIYCLSLKGASDTATQLLAQKENASDLIGGMSAAPAPAGPRFHPAGPETDPFDQREPAARRDRPERAGARQRDPVFHPPSGRVCRAEGTRVSGHPGGDGLHHPPERGILAAAKEFSGKDQPGDIRGREEVHSPPLRERRRIRFRRREPPGEEKET